MVKSRGLRAPSLVVRYRSFLSLDIAFFYHKTMTIRKFWVKIDGLQEAPSIFDKINPQQDYNLIDTIEKDKSGLINHQFSDFD